MEGETETTGGITTVGEIGATRGMDAVRETGAIGGMVAVGEIGATGGMPAVGETETIGGMIGGVVGRVAPARGSMSKSIICVLGRGIALVFAFFRL